LLTMDSRPISRNPLGQLAVTISSYPVPIDLGT
jgi:hypothetical protein